MTADVEYLLKPTRYDLVERIEALIEEYNAGSLNIDEYLRRLVALSQDLSAEERRAATEDMSEEELAIFDLLTKPEPVLTDDERAIVKASAKDLLFHLHDRLVLDWRRKASTLSAVRTEIRDVLDHGLPADPYPPALFEAKVQAVFDHVVTAYGDDTSVYDVMDESPTPVGALATATTAPLSLAAIAEEVVERIRIDAEFAALVAAQLGMGGGGELRTTAQLLTNDEDHSIEFKPTARWDVHEGRLNKAMEDAVIKTVAGFLNADGGTLLIGVGPTGEVLGLDLDYAHVKPTNGDGFVNWLTTLLINAFGPVPVRRTRARITIHDGRELCRLDVAPAAQPVWSKTSKEDRVFFVRMNNSTRTLPAADVDVYVAERWPT